MIVTSPKRDAETIQADRDTCLAAIAIAQHSQQETGILAISRRSRLSYDHVDLATKSLSDRGLIRATGLGNGSKWELTEAGWEAVGQTPPIWMRMVG